MNTSRLSDFIEAQRNAGKVESAGSFTLAIEKARDKLATYTFAKSEDYILKLVQCAVNLGVDELFVELHRNAVVFSFEVDAGDRTLAVDRLSDALLSPLEEKNKARSHLALALCALAAPEPDELMWGEWGPEESLILSLGHSRSELFRDPPFPRVTPLDSQKRFHLLYLQKPVSSLLMQTTGEEDNLRRRCCFAPMTISLNGQPLGASLPPRGSLKDLLKELTGFYLGALRLEQDEPLAFRWPASQTAGLRLPERLQATCADFPPVLVLDLPQDHSGSLLHSFNFSALFGIEAYLYGPSRLHYLKDGILLDAVFVHTAGGGAFALLDGDDTRTDLTGLKVVVDKKVESDQERATDIWQKLVDRYLSSDPPLYPKALSTSGEDTLKKVFPQSLYRGVLKPLINLLNSTRKGSDKDLEVFRQKLDSRRTYIEYFRTD